MPTSATGKHSHRSAPHAMRAGIQHGFTMLELMIVVAIVGIASAAVAFALRDSAENQLDREAQRLVALLESARAESRATGVPLRWQVTPGGFAFSSPASTDAEASTNPTSTQPGTAPTTRPSRWDNEGVQASSAAPITLGPEPVIGPQHIRLWLRDAPERSRWISTDGLRAFVARTISDTTPDTSPTGTPANGSAGAPQ